MGITPGQDWGVATPRRDSDRLVDSNSHLRSLLDASPLTEPLPRVLLQGGDLWRTLGASTRVAAGSADLIEVPVDVGIARFGDETRRFAAHAVIRRRLWTGQSIAAMNSAFIGEWNMAPRAHPGDQALDVLFISMGWQERIQAHRRLRTGTHVPHPHIEMRRMNRLRAEAPRRAKLYLDGDAIATIDSIEIEIDPRPLFAVI